MLISTIKYLAQRVRTNFYRLVEIVVPRNNSAVELGICKCLICLFCDGHPKSAEEIASIERDGEERSEECIRLLI